jgi:hypothetical protein
VAARGGYAETLFFSIALVAVALPALGGAPARLSSRRWLLLGALSGFAFYLFGLIAPAIVTLAVLLAAARAITRRGAALSAAGFLLGAAPLVYENLRHRFVNLRHLVSSGSAVGGVAERTVDFARHLVRLPAHDLPAFFTPWIDDFVTAIPSDAWVYAAGVALLAAAHVAASRADWRPMWRSARGHAAFPGPATFPILYVAVYALLYAASRFAGITPRYLLALYPMLAVLAGCGAAALVASPSRSRRAAGALLVAVLLAIGVVRAALFIGPATTREYNVATRGASIDSVIALLDREKVRVAFATPPVKWKLLWEGKERIAAATCFFAQEDWFRRPALEQSALERAAWGAEPAAFVTHAEFAHERAWGSNEVRSLLAERRRWEEALAARGVRYRVERAGDFLVWWGFTRNVPRLLLAREFYVKGKYLLESGKPAEAAAQLQHARRLDPEDPEIERALAAALARQS